MTSPAPSSGPASGPRRRLPATRTGITHKFSIAGFEGYLTANTYDDGSLGELFINDVGKEGSTLRGALAMFAIATSVALQYGAPPEVLARKLARMNFAPKGPTTNPQMPQAQSLGDYIGRWLASQFCSGDIQAELVASAPPTRPAHPPARSRSSAVPSPPPPATPAPTAAARCSAPAPVRPAPAAPTTPAAAERKPRGYFLRRRPGTGMRSTTDVLLRRRASASLINRPVFAGRERSVNFFFGAMLGVCPWGKTYCAGRPPARLLLTKHCGGRRGRCRPSPVACGVGWTSDDDSV